MKLFCILATFLLAGCGGQVDQAPDFKAGGATVKCEPSPCGGKS